ncbi:MAG: sigma-70 family RNA polymerase sigma factor [Xanthomonadaceae bacterium]|nr:sigma-70 family RNA polymerase sigma factor [Xanthomonadaceae bacterium]
MHDPQTITILLQRCREGDSDSFDELIPVVYHELKRIAHRQLARWRPGQTLNTTALVHESYARLARNAGVDLDNRKHFYAVAARAMRSVVVDYARSLFADKRSGIRADIDLASLPDDGPARAEQVVAVDQLLEKLEALDAQMARIVECRFFAAYTLDETAEALNISRRTVQRKWQRGRAWLAAMGSEAGQ